MGNSGCVSFMFDEKGLIVIDKEEIDMDEEEPVSYTHLDVYKRQSQEQPAQT